MSASYLAHVEAEVTCPLCLYLFVDPRTPKQLECPHIYCKLCLEKLVEGGLCIVTCPECRAITKVPPKTPTSVGGIKDLKTCIRLRSLAENHLKHVEKGAQTLPVKTEGKLKSGPVNPNVPVCLEHDDEKLHFYCVTCKVLVCQACIVVDHEKTTHEIKSAKAVYREKLAIMKEKIKDANDHAKCNKDAMNCVIELEKNTAKAKAATEKAIDDTVEEYMAKVKEQGMALKDKLNQMFQGRLEKCQSRKEKLRYDSQALKTITAEAEGIMENANPYEYLMQHDSLEDQISKINSDGQVDSMIESTGTNGVLRMIPTPVGQIGDVVRVREINVIQRFENDNLLDNLAKGIGGMNGTLAVRTEYDIQIYHKQENGEYQLGPTLEVAESCDVAVNANGKILVAMKNSVKVYKPSGQCERTFYTTKYKNCETVSIRSIAVLSDCRIVVADDGRRAITLHTPEGELLKTIWLDFRPHDISAMEDAKIALCEFHEKVHEYDLDAGTEVFSVDVPNVRCVCYDKETNSLMVGMGTEYSAWIEQYCIHPWELIETVGFSRVYPDSLVFTDKNDLGIFVDNMFYHPMVVIYRCIG